jgi:hypothetical protein
MKLIFVYNARSGKLNALADAAHKLFNPSTYQCSLCALTYDVFSENKIWKAFRNESNLTLEFYHKDEFESLFPSVRMMYPSILKLEDNALTTVLNTDVLNEISTVEELIEKLKSSL